MTVHRAHVVVGVVPRQPEAVVVHAAAFARHFNAELVCAYVDPSRYTVEERSDGTVSSLPFDPDLPDLGEEEFDLKLRDHLASVLDGREVAWTVRALAGDPARALGHLADTLDAVVIVVGTREATIRGSVQEFFGGSVAVHLAHRQHRPVLVIPLAPVGLDQSLPWE